jgi:protein-tyrosine sulfotransferase
VIKPLNLQALTSWFGHIPKDVEEDLAELAPMMATLGYDPADRRPTYGQPDPMVKDKTKEILEEAEEWKRKAEMLIKAKDAEYAGVKDDRANDIGQANQV